jgi:predicted RNA binding protein YcfA (HicA-like mRNA interferase family)
LDGSELIRRLGRLGYEQTRQSGSHVRLTRSAPTGDHHITIPLHSPLRVGTLNAILNDVAAHVDMSKDELLRQLQ